MSGIRAQIAEPTVLSLAHTTAPPLGFVIAEDVPQRGIQERLDEFSLAQHLPWFTELVLSLRGTSAKLCLYRLPVSDDLWLQAACVGEFPEPLFDMLTKPDYGNALTALVQKEWPDVFGMLVASTQRSLDRRVMMQVQNISGSQWVIADPVHADDPRASSPATIESLALCALETVVRFGSPAQSLPGLLEVLGGPDMLSRRLSALSTGLSSVAGIGGALGKLFSGQIPNIAELVEALRGAVELPEAVQQFRA